MTQYKLTGLAFALVALTLAGTTAAGAQQYPKCTFGFWEVGDRCSPRPGVVCERREITGYNSNFGGDWKCWHTRRPNRKKVTG